MSNQYTYSVPFTEQQLSDDYSSGMTQEEIGRKYGVSQKVVWKAMSRMGIPTRVAKKRDQYGTKNSSWNGGRVLVAKSKKQRNERSSFGNGYFYVLAPDHPNCNKSGYVAEHIVVALNAAGKDKLSKGEVVHHIDLDKHNNSSSNLAICDRITHANWHNQLEELAVQFMRAGLIEFSIEHGYRRTP